MITVAGGFRSAVFNLPRDGRERAGNGLLVGPRPPTHAHRRRLGRAAVLHQLARDLTNEVDAHEDDQRFGLAHLAPIDGARVMAGNEGHQLGVIAMRERNAGVGRDAQRRGNARHHFKRNARRGQRLDLFAATAENKRIAALEPDHIQTAARARSSSRRLSSCEKACTDFFFPT